MELALILAKAGSSLLTWNLETCGLKCNFDRRKSIGLSFGIRVNGSGFLVYTAVPVWQALCGMFGLVLRSRSLSCACGISGLIEIGV